MSNITVLGFINITNLNPSVTTDVRLSKFFGNVIPKEASLLTKRLSNFANIYSSVVYSINGTPITYDNFTLNGLNVRLVNTYDTTSSAA
jgi:hypothetical protein